MKNRLQNIKNIIDFSLRNRFDISKRNYQVENEPKENLFTGKEVQEREEELVQKYNLTSYKNNSTISDYKQNLYLLDILDKHLKTKEATSVKILDIGSKNWFYAPSEHSFFKKHFKNFSLTGIEIDPNRLYTNLYSRKEVALFNIKGLINTKYLGDDFLNHEGFYDYIIWILPFVSVTPHLNWGLPTSNFKPIEMLAHAYESLKEKGQIFIINQGEKELKLQQELARQVSVNYKTIGKIESPFFEYENERFLTLVRK